MNHEIMAAEGYRSSGSSHITPDSSTSGGGCCAATLSAGAP
ncbi:hypothetical protein ACIBJD_11680 [Kitasatospora sp. NPDC050467]